VQAFANDVATQAVAQAGVAADAALGGQGAIYSYGGHIICGMPPVEQLTLKE
jgi:hypothetical protein